MRRFVIVVVLLVPALASAQWVRGPEGEVTRPELTLFGGYRDGGRVDGIDTDRFTYKFTADVGGSATYGLALDLPLGGSHQLELWVSRGSGDLRADHTLSTGSADLGDLEVTYLQLGVVRSWFRHRSAMYAGLGAGVTRLAPQVGGFQSDTRFSASIAGGAKYLLAEHLGVRFDLRGYWTAGNADLSSHSGAVYIGYPGNFLQVEGSVGVTLLW